jgi:predicted aldo/keto reductase-like oxidoreductase
VLRRAKEEGKIRAIAVSTHARRYAGELVRDGKLDVLMMRYNAAQRGAEEEIVPYLATSTPGVVSYTATRWGRLLRRPRGWPESERIPIAGDCYRFALTNSRVDVCLTCPGNARLHLRRVTATYRIISRTSSTRSGRANPRLKTRCSAATRLSVVTCRPILTSTACPRSGTQLQGRSRVHSFRGTRRSREWQAGYALFSHLRGRCSHHPEIIPPLEGGLPCEHRFWQASMWFH